NEVAIFVEDKFVGISKSRGKDFKVTSVRIGPDDHALVGIFEFLAIYRGDVRSDVANTPVNFTIGTFNNSRHTVSTKADVDCVAMADGFFLVENTIVIGIPKSPKV